MDELPGCYPGPANVTNVGIRSILTYLSKLSGFFPEFGYLTQHLFEKPHILPDPMTRIGLKSLCSCQWHSNWVFTHVDFFFNFVWLNHSVTNKSRKMRKNGLKWTKNDKIWLPNNLLLYKFGLRIKRVLKRILVLVTIKLQQRKLSHAFI